MFIIDERLNKVMILVTVIVPVYNVFSYIDRCVESIINQSYKELEILLINDGSTDNSLDKCLEWRKRDGRIIVIDKKNEKQGPTRNYGVCIARGEYITYVDSDDWIDRFYIEKMLMAAKKYSADMVVCNYYRVFEKTNEKCIPIYAVRNSIIEGYKEKIQYMKEKPLAACWGKLYRRSLLQDNQINQPNNTAEDLAVLTQVIACSNRIITMEDALYFYYSDRSASTSNSVNMGIDFPYIMEYSVQEMKRLNLFEKYEEGQMAILSWHLSVMLKNYDSYEKFYELKKTYEILFNNLFPKWKDKVGMKWLVYGSFNSRWVAQMFSQSLLCTPNHYPFTSLISQFMGEKNIHYIVEHDNEVRKTAVKNDIESAYEKIELVNEEGILVDFIEERNNILETEDGIYISESEVFQECEVKGLKIKRVIESGTEEFMNLWKQSCLSFINHLKKISGKKPIFLLKMRMATGTGIGKRETLFDNQEEIIRINNMLNTMDRFFIDNYEKVIYVQGEDNLYYSQTGHNYGCKPYHLNGYLYQDMIKKMKK